MEDTEHNTSANDVAKLKEEDDRRSLDYRDRLLIVIEKGQETFEKQLSFISGGAIVATLLIIEKFYEHPWETSYKVILMAGILAFALSLLINLLSHLSSSEGYAKVVYDIELNRSGYDFNKAAKCRCKVRSMNNWSVVLLFIGLFAVIIFISLNSIFMSNDKSPTPPKPIQSKNTKVDSSNQTIKKPNNKTN